MTRRTAFWAIYVTVSISYLGVGLVAPLISIVLAQHGANSFVVGLVGTAMFTGFAAAAFPVGHIADRVGTKPVLVTGLVTYGVAILLFAFIRHTWLFFVVRAVEGMGGAAISVSTETLINQISDSGERAKRMSYYALSVGLGWALGPVTGTSLFALHEAVPFVACCGFSVIAAVLVFLYAPQIMPKDHKTRGLSGVINKKMVIPLSSAAIYGYLMSSLVTLFPLYLKDKGIAEVVMGTIITSVIIGTLLCQIPIGRAADRYGKSKVLFACAIVMAVLFILLPRISAWWYFVGVGVMLGGMAGSLYPVGLSMVGAAVREERLGAATSIFSLSFGMGCLFGPSISGLAMGHLGNDWLFFLPAILSGILSLEISILDRRGHAL